MSEVKVGAVVLGLLFTLSVGAESTPQDGKKPMSSSTVDGGVKSIAGYKDQAAVAEDGEFLRRVMFDLVGYPPNLEQVKAFMADTSPNKRPAKIDELLATDDWAGLWERQFSEVWFGNYHEVVMDTMPKVGKEASAKIVADFRKWFKGQLGSDKPWNEIVAKMLDARGTDEGDPAMAYKLSFYFGDGQAMEFANGTARHLLGVRILCARCHDHPFDRWKVEDYYGLAAFNVRQRARGYGNGGEKDSVAHVELKYADEGEMQIEKSPDANDKDNKVKLAGGGTAKPKFLYGGEAGPKDDRAKVLTMLMTGKANTQLPRALANRVWGYLFGRGIVQPVDDFNMRNRALSPGLLESLTKELIGNKYSVKHLIRVICNSDAYQRSCESDKSALKIDFSRGAIKQLSGEQLINAIQVATQGKPGKNHGQAMQMVNSLYPAGAVWCEVTPLPGNARQALLLRNNTEVSGWISSGGVLGKIKAMQGSDEDKINEMFLAALSRPALDSEIKRYWAFLKQHSGGWEDAYWTLLNTAEFVTRH